MASTAAAEVEAIMRIRIITTTLKKKKKEEGHEYEQGDYIIIKWSTVVEGQANQSTDIIVIQGSGNVEQIGEGKGTMVIIIYVSLNLRW